MIPREHGAWSMLLTPFFSGLLLARQRYVWREARPESDVAWRWILWEMAALAAAGVSLLWLWPWQLVIGFGGAAALLTVAAVWMTVKNRQRSIALQVASAGGLAASSLAACIAATGGIREWAVWLWVLCTAHSVASIVVVHARLETRIALRVPDKEVTSRRPAWIAQFALLAGAVACLALERYWLGAALLLSAAVHMFDLVRLAEAAPLRTVGLRALGLSVVFAVIVVAGLWSQT